MQTVKISKSSGDRSPKGFSCSYKRIIAGLAIALGLGAPHGLRAEDYSLGAVLGLTGSGASWSADCAEAIKMAVEEINAEGGFLKKYPINLVVVDDQAKADQAATVAKELIVKQKTRCIIGTWSSSCALAIKPLCAESKVLHIAPISNSEDITKLNPSPYTFSVVPNTYMLAKATSLGIAKAAKEKGWKSYATITSDYAFGRNLQGNIVSMLKGIAPELVLKKEVWPPLAEGQWAPHIMALASAQPDFINFNLTGDDAMRFMTTAGSNFFKKFPCPGMTLSVTELVSKKDILPRGTLAVTRAAFFGHLNEPAMKNFMDKFTKKQAGRYPSDWHVLGYDAVMTLKQGIEKAASIDTEAVRAALSGATIDTCRGKLAFRALDNQLICPVYWGTVADDPAYPFPIYHDLQVISGTDITRPEAEVVAARNQAGQK